MSDTTTNLELPYIAPAQAQKHVTHNEALRKLDAIVHLAVIDRDIGVPPAAPAEGDRYIVGPSPSGVWAGADGQIAAFQDGAWAFLMPRIGWSAWVTDEDALLVYADSGWTAAATGGGGAASVNPTPLVGINATADATNRLAVKSDAVLMSHDDVTPGSGDMRVSVNKSAPGNVASVVFQENYSGRAEFGVTSSTAFELKTSDDGSTFTSALSVDLATAEPYAPQGVVIGEGPSDTEAVQLTYRGDEVPNYGVLNIRAKRTDSPSVIDVMPNGTGGNDLTGRAWIHVLNSDLETVADPNQWQACTIAARIDECVIGSMSGGTQPILPIAVAGDKINFKSKVTGAGTVNYAQIGPLGFILSQDDPHIWFATTWTRLRSNYELFWTASGNAYGTPDTGLRRSGTGQVEVNDGTAASLGQLVARSVKVATYTVATVPSAATEGAGSVIYVSDASGGATLAVSDGTGWRAMTSAVLA